ncbi:general substrate transporter [Nemania sp. FL0916]|nr:general substrate transporter [Nemania sp. FL0916]
MAGGAPQDPSVADMSLRQRLKHLNGFLAFLLVFSGFCAFNYGYDVGTFGGVQGLHSFASKFGECDKKGVCALPGWLSSVMTATPFLGKALGCIGAGWVAERFGRKATFYLLCIVSLIGVTLQTASETSRAQFTLGRIITYGQTGIAIVLVPIYQAETTPRELRGMFASTIQLMIIFGQVVSSLVTYGTKGIPSSAGWRIPIGLQLVSPVILLLLLTLVPESPRWLLDRQRDEDAFNSLRKLRKNASTEDIHLEIESLKYAGIHEDKGTWAEVFDKNNKIRTTIAIVAMFGQQITGQAFPSQYGVIFYQSQGFGDKSFLYNVIGSIVSLVACFLTWGYVDQVGRRPLLMVGGFFMGVWLFVLGGLGTMKTGDFTPATSNLLVASLQLFNVFYNLSWAPISYVVVSEAATLRLKGRTNLLASVISVLTTFVVSFTTPYLINAKYANLGGKVGFIYGSFNFAMVIATFFLIPEMKGRTLEEIDQLFASGVPLRKFGGVKTRTAQELYETAIDKKADNQEDAPAGTIGARTAETA